MSTIDDVLGELGNFVKPRENTRRNNDGSQQWINRVYMSVPPNQGTIYLIPLRSSDDKFFTLIDNVKEMKLEINEGQSPKWVKLLPREFYNFADNSAEHLLYNELLSLHHQLANVHGNAWKDTARHRNYMLLSGFVIKHKDVNQEELSQGKMSLFIFDHKRLATSMNAEIKSRIDMKGGHEWMLDMFSRTDLTKNQMMKLQYYNDAGNWVATCQISNFNDDNAGLLRGVVSDENLKLYTSGEKKPVVTITESQVELIGDHINQFLSCENNDARFDIEYYQKVKTLALKALAIHAPKEQLPDSQVQVEQSVPETPVVEKPKDDDVPF